MPTVVNLPPEIEGRVIAEAARIAANRRAAAVALLDSWLASADSEEQRETSDAFLLGLDANRPGQRQLFPPEAKGRTW